MAPRRRRHRADTHKTARGELFSLLRSALLRFAISAEPSASAPDRGLYVDPAGAPRFVLPVGRWGGRIDVRADLYAVDPEGKDGGEYDAVRYYARVSRKRDHYEGDFNDTVWALVALNPELRRAARCARAGLATGLLNSFPETASRRAGRPKGGAMIGEGGNGGEGDNKCATRRSGGRDAARPPSAPPPAPTEQPPSTPIDPGPSDAAMDADDILTFLSESSFASDGTLFDPLPWPAGLPLPWDDLGFLPPEGCLPGSPMIPPQAERDGDVDGFCLGDWTDK